MSHFLRDENLAYIKAVMDKFMFFSKSAHKPPGTGVHEELGSSPKKYTALAKVKDWRKTLSNFYESEFELDGKRWLSVEHFYQGSKFRQRNPQFFNLFSLDSGSEISQDPCKAKRAGGKTGGGLRPKSVKIDPGFFTNNNHVFYRAMVAKFSQNPRLKKILLDTKDAQLLHKTRGIPLQRVFPLEEARDSLRKIEALAKHLKVDPLFVLKCWEKTTQQYLRDGLAEKEILEVIFGSTVS